MTNVLDNLLDATLDDLADLPEFKAFPNGVHQVAIKFEAKEVNNNPCIELTLKLIETVELANANDEPLQPGAESTVLYMMNNEFGAGKFKEIIKPIAAHLNTSNIREAIEGANGMEVVVVTKQRQNKDKTQTYTDVAKLEVI